MPDDGRIWLSVDYQPPHRFGPRFPTAQAIRRLLREEGRRAVFFSTRERLEKIAGNPEDVVFPFDEPYPAGDSPDDLNGLRKAMEELGIPFIGGGYRAITDIGDKRWAKRTLAAGGIDVPPGIVLEDPAYGEEDVERFLAAHRCPAVVKPVSGPGASIGVRYLADEAALRAYVRDWSGKQSQPLLLEEWVAGTEITVWVLGVEPDVRAVGVFQVPRGGAPILDHDLKIGMRRLADDPEPDSELTPEATRLAGEAAVACHRLLGAYSYSRTDMIVHDGRPVVLELNPHPKFLHHEKSGLTAALGKSLGEVVDVLADHARKRPAAAP